MEVNKELILKVAKNARLNLTDSEIKEFIPQFNEILESFKELNNINTNNIKPSFQPIEIKNVLREDSPKESIPTDIILKNTKHKENNYFKGPKAI